MAAFFAIALGGAIGAVLRFLMTETAYKITGLAFPWGTIAVNLLGCFLIGLAWGIFEVFDTGNNTKLFLFTGILGAFTTFSTFALENFNLFKNGEIHLVALNVSISNIAGIFLVFMGFYLTRFFFAFINK